MAALREFDVATIVKVLGGAVGFQEHEVRACSFSELDSWLLQNVDENGRYEVYSAGSAHPLTASEWDRLKSSAVTDGTRSVVLHVRPQSDAFQPARHHPARQMELRSVVVKQAGDGSAPVAGWKADEEGSVAHYEVSVIDENFGPQASDYVIETQQVAVPVAGRDPRFFMHQLHPDSVHRVEVRAVSQSGVSGESRLARFYPQRKVKPGSTEAAEELQQLGDRLQALCAEFSAKLKRDPTFLVIGKQHHGKSSLVNHLIRCLTQRMSTADQVEAAPASKMETTLRLSLVPIAFRSHKLTVCDMPAFSTMSPDRKRDLNNLLWCVGPNWARGEKCWWPASSPPDAVIIVVSLLNWRDERDSLSDYLKELQAVLKYERSVNRGVVFPFVVVATHQDKFLEEEGNAGRDPIAELERAESQLKSMANTEYVFSLSNYRDSAWWVPAVTRSTHEMLCQLVTLAKNRTRSVQEGVLSPPVVGYVGAVVSTGLVLLAIILQVWFSALN